MARNCGEEQGQSIAKQRMSIAPMSEGIAKAEVFYKRSRREGGAMGKKGICNMDCFRCVHPDCINERPMTRQARYYWRHRDRLLAEKREKYRRKKNELEGLPERKE